MENIDASKLSIALLQRYTEQIKPPAVSGGSIFYGLACKFYIVILFFFLTLIVSIYIFLKQICGIY